MNLRNIKFYTTEIFTNYAVLEKKSNIEAKYNVAYIEKKKVLYKGI